MKSDKCGKVILVVVEDLTRRAMEETETPNMDVLIKAGALGFARQPVASSSKSFPLCGILTSREPACVLDSNERDSLMGAADSIVDMAHGKGRSTAGYFYRSRFHNLFHLYGPFDYPALPTSEHARGNNQARIGTAAMAAKEIVSLRPDFCLIYIASQENVGGRPAVGCPLNLKHVRMSDASLGVLLGSLSLFGLFGEYHILLTGEMGGRYKDYEERSPAEFDVPWLAFGPRIARGMTIGGPVSLADTAPTMAELMDLPSMPSWQGKPLHEAILGPECNHCERSVA